jgi:sorting nexin-29
VAEMHGELIEFNEYLQKQVQLKDLCIQRMREELIDLRGPLPADDLEEVDAVSMAASGESVFGDSSSVASGPSSRALLHIWIPSVFLSGTGSRTHHVYQVYLRIKNDEWNIYKRYSDFYRLHIELKKQEPLVDAFDFPPKKTVGYKTNKVVEERRKRLQTYLRKIVNLMIQTNTCLTTKPCKESVVLIMPFLPRSSLPLDMKE